MNVAMLHYASPPVVGGVESTMAYHARGLRKLGHAVRIISGDGAAFDAIESEANPGSPAIDVHINPLFGSRDPHILTAKKSLDAGQVPAEFNTLKAEIAADLRAALQDFDVCISHNVHTLNKNLPLTAALAELTRGDKPVVRRSLAWCHDLAWANEQYLPELHPSAPWNLLKQVWPNTHYVTVSEPRRHELARLLKLSPDKITVVMPGVDLNRQLFLTPTTQRLAQTLGLMEADGLLLVPARLTRRKNIELGLRVLAELRMQSGKDFRLIVTGPPGPHNPNNPGYLGELLALRQALGLEGAAHFLYEQGPQGQPLVPDDDTMANLFALADALFFPSTQEGFGIPVLEAALAYLPVFCADIPPLRATAGELANYFDPLKEPASNIAARMLAMLGQSDPFALRVRVRQHFRWDTIIERTLVPLLQA
jgi:glycosyltransferase involved in cell wall biosynthesis